MTINAPAIVLMAFYLGVAAQHARFDWSDLQGTIQNDILKEFHAQNEVVFPPRPSVRLVIDLIEFCTARGAAVEHSFDQRLSHPRSRLDRGAGAGLHAGRRPALCRAVRSAAVLLIDDFAPRLSFFFNAHNDFFEEVAKYRAARSTLGRTDAR